MEMNEIVSFKRPERNGTERNGTERNGTDVARGSRMNTEPVVVRRDARYTNRSKPMNEHIFDRSHHARNVVRALCPVETPRHE